MSILPIKSNSPIDAASSATRWVGRFAPSPTGPLHMGSLAAAVASYMVAKQKNGKWLVRIEDIDKNREVSGATDSILADLENYGLFWDDKVFYQSKNKQWHRHVIEELLSTQLLYACRCSRKDIFERNSGVYDAKCRTASNQVLTLSDIDSRPSDEAIKINFCNGSNWFDDQILNRQKLTKAVDKQDFIIKRRDGVYAYQLVVVADDIYQEINHVVRGMDILDSTTKQNFLYDCLGKTIPRYYHIPLIKNQNNLKLSKSLNSLSLKDVEYLQDQKKVIPRSEILLMVLKHLGQKIDYSLKQSSPQEIIEYYVKHWDTGLVKLTV